MRYSGIGGQAVMEGVMMKNQEKYAVAVRKPDQEIVVETSTYEGLIKNKKIRNMPILRGVFSFIESLVLGMKTLTFSASFFEEEEDEKSGSRKAEKRAGAILEPLGIPRELISFMIMRPVSGSGTLAIIENIAQTFGPDSFLCRCASVMMGSSETLLYAVAVYFGATRVSSLRHTIPAGVAGYAAGIWLSIVLCKIM